MFTHFTICTERKERKLKEKRHSYFILSSSAIRMCQTKEILWTLWPSISLCSPSLLFFSSPTMPHIVPFYLSLISNQESLTNWPLMNTWKALIGWSVFVRSKRSVCKLKCVSSSNCSFHLRVCAGARGLSAHCYGHFHFDNTDFARMLFKPFPIHGLWASGFSATGELLIYIYSQGASRAGGELYCLWAAEISSNVSWQPSVDTAVTDWHREISTRNGSLLWIRLVWPFILREAVSIALINLLSSASSLHCLLCTNCSVSHFLLWL